MSQFTGKRVVITGASRGIGFEAAKMLLAAGAEVFGTGRDQKRLTDSAIELNKIGKFIPFLADFDDPKAPTEVAQAVQSIWPALDILVNNAAIQTYNDDWFAEDIERLPFEFRCNVIAPHQLTYLLAPLLKNGNQPRIVNVSSGAGTTQSLVESFDMPTYRLTKYALGGLTMLWAGTFKDQVAVNALDPGWLKTDLGGPDAPGEPVDGGKRTLEILSLDWNITGRFFYGDQEIDY